MLPLLPSAREHLNALGPEGDTLLHIASLYGYADLVDALLAAGSNPEVKDENKSTPLVRCLSVAANMRSGFAHARQPPQHDASAGGYINIVRKLLAVCPQLVREVDDDDELALVSPGPACMLARVAADAAVPCAALRGARRLPRRRGCAA